MKIIEKLKPLLLLQGNKEPEHYKNLQKGEKIEIDGKEYVKIKFKLVDTMDINSAKMIHNLETENKLLTEHNHELKVILEEYSKKVSLFELLNHNLISVSNQKSNRIKKSKAKVAKYKKEIAKLEKQAKGRKREIHQLINQITYLKEKLK